MECEWTRDVCKILRSQNALVFAIVGSRMQEPGWPDRYIAHQKWSGWLEFKDTRTKVMLKQQIIIRRLVERGVNAYFVRRYGDLCTLYTSDMTYIDACVPEGLLEMLRTL